jgi:hypothetical protein
MPRKLNDGTDAAPVKNRFSNALQWEIHNKYATFTVVKFLINKKLKYSIAVKYLLV